MQKAGQNTVNKEEYAMEDNKFSGTYGFQELNLDELNRVAGGRSPRKAEIEDWGTTYTWYCNTFDRLTTQHDYDRAIMLRDTYEKATERYKADMAAASNDSPDILFSSYFTEWM